MKTIIKMTAVALLGAGVFIGGCETKAGSGALIGAGAGAALGGVIGNNSHGRTGAGMAIGAGVGAISGALIGNQMDKADQKKAKQEEQERDYQRYRSSSETMDRSPSSP